MSSFKMKLPGRAPETAYLEGAPRPRKKLARVVDPSRRNEYLRRMIADMRKREARMQAVWAELARKGERKARQEGYGEGFDAGRAEGYGEGRAAVQPVAAKLEELIDRLKEDREKIIAGASRFVVQLACEMAVRIVHGELKTDPKIILNQVEAALAKVVDKEKVTVRVCPSDLEAVRGEEKTWREILEGVGNFAVEEDPNLKAGDVVVETNSGVVDARIEAQIAHMHKVITEVMKDGA